LKLELRKLKNVSALLNVTYKKWGSFYLIIVYFFATQIKGGAKELVVLL